MDHRDAIGVLPPSYHELFERASERFHADDRVRALWLGGSLARGTADAASDLDLILAVADGDFDAFAADWRAWLGDITPTVLAAELPFVKGIVHSVTPGFERLDVVVEPVSAVPTTPHPTRTVVFDRDGLDAQIARPPLAGGPSAGAVEALITEYFRVNAVETVLVRDDWLLAREHLHLVSSLLYRLFVEANAPLPSMGVKQWSTKLTAGQQALLRSLATSVHDLAGLREAHTQVAVAFLSNADHLAAELGISWPDDLEAAAAHLRRHLELDEPFPRNPTAVVIG